MKRRWKRGVLLMLCAALLCSLASAAAETTIRASVGYDAAMLCGRWIPLSVEITADESPVEGMLSVDVGVSAGQTDRLRQPVSVPAGETRTYRIPIRPRVNQRAFEVRLDDGGDTLSTTARVVRAVPEDALVIGVLGEETEPLARALREIELRDVRGQLETVEAVALDADNFARDAREMSAFDALVVLDRATRELDDASVEALEDWRQAGGILVHKGSADSSMLAPELAAQQVMGEIEAAQRDGQGVTRENDNFPYSVSLNAEMTAGRAGGLLPAAVFLTVYVLLAGVGAYLLMKRLDRSKMLWAVIPALAIAACGVMAALGAGLGLNRPMSSSVHLVHYDADGETSVREMAMLTYAGQARKVVSTQNNAPLGRMEYTGFNGYTNGDEPMELRDVLTLGGQPSIELEGKADWFVRNLVVENQAAPQGSVTALAHMEEDGLHVEAENNTDVTIENAVLVTEVGYALLGDLTPGASKQTVLLRTDEAPLDDNGNILIREERMLPFSTSLYNVNRAAVDPEEVLDPAWSASSLPMEEQMRRQKMQSVLNMGAGSMLQKGLGCMLVGETPQIACETLLLDGEPVTRRAEKSVLACTAAFEPVSSSGYFYYPERTFERLEASLDANGMPVLGERLKNSYICEKDEFLFGFQLEGVDAEGIEEIRLYVVNGLNAGNRANMIAIEAYDYASGKWARLEEEDGLIRMDAALSRRAVSPSGALCLRVSGDKMAEQGVSLPELIVEGHLREKQEGGEAA